MWTIGVGFIRGGCTGDNSLNKFPYPISERASLPCNVKQLPGNLLSHIARPTVIYFERYNAQWTFILPAQNVIDDCLFVGSCFINLPPDAAPFSEIVKDQVNGLLIDGSRNESNLHQKLPSIIPTYPNVSAAFGFGCQIPVVRLCVGSHKQNVTGRFTPKVEIPSEPTLRPVCEIPDRGAQRLIAYECAR